MPAFFKADVIDMKWALRFSRAVLAAVLIVVFLICGNQAIAHALTSININGQDYNLVVLSNNEHSEAIKLFNSNAKLYKRNINIDYCDFIIDLPAGTARGDHSYGGYCTSRVDKEYEHLTICSDFMLGRLKIQSHGKTNPKNNIDELAKYVAENCTGG